MPLGSFRHSLNLANPVATVDYGTYQGYFRPSSSTVLNAYNTAGTSQSTVTHGCGTVAYIRARRIPGTTSHIVGVSGATASKFYRYTPGTGFVQLASFTASGRSCDIAFDTTNSKIYMAASRSTTPFVQIYQADLSATVTTSTQLGNPSVLPAASVNTVKFSPNGLVLATLGTSGSPLMRVYTRSGSTFTSVTAPTSVGQVNEATGHYGLSWNADSTALAYMDDVALGLRITKWTGSAFGGTVAVSPFIDCDSMAFNPNPSYSNIILVSDEANEYGAAFYYNFALNSIVTSSQNSSPSYQMEHAQWSPDGLKVFLQHSSSAGRTFDLNTSYSSGNAIATLLGSGTTMTLNARGFDWMYH